MMRATRITVDGKQHIVRSGSFDHRYDWVSIDPEGDWIGKADPNISKVEHGRLVFVLDEATNESKPTPEQLQRLSTVSPNVLLGLTKRHLWAIRQIEEALHDSRVDVRSPAAVWLRTIRNTLNGDEL